MELHEFAEVVAFAMPVALLGVGAAAEKLIEGKPWAPRHFFVGLDLTIYFLTACLANIVDLTRDRGSDPKAYLWTVVLITFAIVMLFLQTAVHQEWEDESKSIKGQIVWLCGASNAVGLILLYAFVRMKLDGLL